jgi:hypothetical protein
MHEIQYGGYCKLLRQGSRHVQIGFSLHAASYLIGTGYSFQDRETTGEEITPLTSI